MKNLLSLVGYVDHHCEHECIIGALNEGNNNRLISKSFVFNGSNAEGISLFNFCPACGQELNIKATREFTEVVTFKENK